MKKILFLSSIIIHFFIAQNARGYGYNPAECQIYKKLFPYIENTKNTNCKYQTNCSDYLLQQCNQAGLSYVAIDGYQAWCNEVVEDYAGQMWTCVLETWDDVQSCDSNNFEFCDWQGGGGETQLCFEGYGYNEIEDFCEECTDGTYSKYTTWEGEYGDTITDMKCISCPAYTVNNKNLYISSSPSESSQITNGY